MCSASLFSKAERNNRCCTNHPDLPTCERTGAKQQSLFICASHIAIFNLEILTILLHAVDRDTPPGVASWSMATRRPSKYPWSRVLKPGQGGIGGSATQIPRFCGVFFFFFLFIIIGSMHEF